MWLRALCIGVLFRGFRSVDRGVTDAVAKCAGQATLFKLQCEEQQHMTHRMCNDTAKRLRLQCGTVMENVVNVAWRQLCESNAVSALSQCHFSAIASQSQCSNFALVMEQHCGNQFSIRGANEVLVQAKPVAVKPTSALLANQHRQRKRDKSQTGKALFPSTSILKVVAGTAGTLGRVPVFIIVRDRLEALKETIAGLAQLQTSLLVVIVDMASSYAPLLAYLEMLQEEGVEVIRRRNKKPFREMRDAIWNYMELHREHQFYVITDSDILLDKVRPNALQVYADILFSIDGLEKVGPALRLDDIPDAYPFKYRGGGHSRDFGGVLKWESQFWNDPVLIEYNEAGVVTHIPAYEAAIDTTFALYHRRSESIKQGHRIFPVQRALRVGSPYGARHLGWYLDPENCSADEIYYASNVSGTGQKMNNWSPCLNQMKT